MKRRAVLGAIPAALLAPILPAPEAAGVTVWGHRHLASGILQNRMMVLYSVPLHPPKGFPTPEQWNKTLGILSQGQSVRDSIA